MKKTTPLQYVYAVFLTLLVGCVFLYIAGIWPFGASCFTFIDNAQCAAPSLASLKLIIAGVEDWNWTFLSGGVNRTALLAGYHLFFMPTVWLACLLPADSCLQSQSWLFLIQIACCSATALFYLRKTFPHCPDALKLALALSYTFSDFLFTKFTYLPFLNISALFPLFLYSLDLLLKRGKYWPYLLISTYMMAVGPYFYWMWGIFTMVYVAARLKLGWTLYKNPTVRMPLLLLLGMTLLAAVFSAFSWFPSYVLTAESARAGRFAKRDFFAESVQLGLLTCWMISPLMFCVLAMLKKSCRSLMSSPYCIALILLVIGCCCVPINYLIHMGPPVSFPVRFSYMITMMSCCVAAQCSSGEGTTCYKKWWLAVVLAAAGLLAYSSSIPEIWCWLWLAAVSISALLCYFRFYKTCVCVLCGILSIQLVKSFGDNKLSRVEDIADRVTQAEELPQALQAIEHEPWSRVRSVDLCLTSNFSQVCGINSFCNYFHSSTQKHQLSVNRLGYVSYFTRIVDTGGSVFADAFMGCEFMVSRYPMAEHLLQPIAVRDSLYLYRDPYYWGDGVLLPEAVVEQSPEWGDDPIANQQMLFWELGGEGQLFTPKKAKLEWDEEDRLFVSYQTDGHEWLYLPTRSLPVYAQCFARSWYEERCAEGWVGEADIGVLTMLPTADNRQTLRVLQLRMSENSSVQQSFEKRNGAELALYRLDTEKVASLADRHRGTVRISSIQGRDMVVEICPKAGNNVLLLPYVYHKGYHARDEEGNELAVNPHHGFTAITLSKTGKQKVLLHYSLPYEAGTMLVSAAGLLLMLSFPLLKRLPKPPTLEKRIGTAKKLIALAAVLGSWLILSGPIWSKVMRYAVQCILGL